MRTPAVTDTSGTNTAPPHRIDALALLAAVLASALLAGCGGSSVGGPRTGRTGPSRGASRTASASSSPPGRPAPAKTPSGGAGQPTRPSMLAFAKCMRAHGVPSFPDPRPPGRIPAARSFQPAPSGGFTANPSSPAYRAASNACRSLADASPVSAATAATVMAGELEFAVCMRAHGVPSFPDPTSSGEIGDNGAISGVDRSSPAFRSAEEACGRFLSHPPPLAGRRGSGAGG
jgi:hypothetical protein